MQGLQERRQSYRIPTGGEGQAATAVLFLNGGDAVPVEIVNYSGGGLLFRTGEALRVMLGDVIPKIEIQFAREHRMQFQGRVMRVQRQGEKLVCGVQFGKIAPHEIETPPEDGRDNHEVTEALRRKWLHKLHAAPVQHPQEAFESTLANLATECRWWFDEVLQELKRRAPKYPPKLVDEFVALCEWGEPALPPKPAWHGSRFRFISRLRKQPGKA